MTCGARPSAACVNCGKLIQGRPDTVVGGIVGDDRLCLSCYENCTCPHFPGDDPNCKVHGPVEVLE